MVALRNYWVTKSNMTWTAYKCAVGACLGGSNRSSICASGRKQDDNPLCGECMEVQSSAS